MHVCAFVSAACLPSLSPHIATLAQWVAKFALQFCSLVRACVPQSPTHLTGVHIVLVVSLSEPSLRVVLGLFEPPTCSAICTSPIAWSGSCPRARLHHAYRVVRDSVSELGW